jgi:hypothetical protein
MTSTTLASASSSLANGTGTLRGDRSAPGWKAQVGRLARRAGTLAATVLGWVPLTPLGLLAIPLVRWLRSAYGVDRHDGVLRTLSSGALILAGLCILLVFLTALWLRLRRVARSSATLEIEAGSRFRTGFHLGWCHWNPFIKIDVTWERPEGVAVQLVGHEGKLVEEVTASVRTLEKDVVRCIRVSDILGLARVTFRQSLPQHLRITPNAGQPTQVALKQQALAGDEQAHPEGRAAGDYLEMRQYGPGDPLRFIMWKVYARTGELLVRMPERAVTPSRKTLVYFVAGPGDEPGAGLARSLLESGQLGNEYHFGADGSTAMMRTAGEALDQLVRSAPCRAAGGEGLESFLRRGETLGLGACILFVPPRPGAWLPRVLAQLARFRGPFLVLIGVDGVRPTHRRARLRNWLLVPESGDLPTSGEVRQIHEALARTGAEVRIVNRRTGQEITPSSL